MLKLGDVGEVVTGDIGGYDGMTGFGGVVPYAAACGKVCVGCWYCAHAAYCMFWYAD